MNLTIEIIDVQYGIKNEKVKLEKEEAKYIRDKGRVRSLSITWIIK